MDNIKEGWFTETCTLWPGQAMSLQVEEILYKKKSKFQDVMVFKSKTYGNVLVLDGVIQCTERDEFSYQEMIANLPICSHPSPQKVLIIGGGDGGVLREVVKHPLVESVVQCEIDEDVINVSKKYLPGMAEGFFSPKLTLHVGDGFEFMKQNQDAFDIIITDSSDPVGPAESLFKESYYQLMKTALREGGILCCQGECQWLHLELIKEMRTFCKTLFPVVEYAYCTIPTYPSGQIGFMLCSKNTETNFWEPVKELSKDEVESMNLKYYNSGVHRASFILPEFARKVYCCSSRLIPTHRGARPSKPSVGVRLFNWSPAAPGGSGATGTLSAFHTSGECAPRLCHSMQLLVVLAALMGVLFSVRAAAVLPAEDRSNFHTNRELSKERKELILKLVSGLLDGAADSNMLPGEPSPALLDLEEPLESRLEERAVYNRLSLPQRDRKAPCKNFFWKTFTSC
ncbi:unnamed protein product [Merluccius merluccius]